MKLTFCIAAHMVVCFALVAKTGLVTQQKKVSRLGVGKMLGVDTAGTTYLS